MINDSVTRREFLQLITALAATLPASSYALGRPQTDEAASVYDNLQDPWLTLADVQLHLLPPGENSPSAKDILALRFLRNQLDAPDTEAEDKTFIFNGVDWLNDFAQQHHKTTFVKLDHEQKEQLLRKIEKSRAGSQWLSRMMTYLVEALLSDPAYGGNRDQAGWQWLQHQPGFPRPGKDKIYFKLGAHASDKRKTRA